MTFTFTLVLLEAAQNNQPFTEDLQLLVLNELTSLENTRLKNAPRSTPNKITTKSINAHWRIAIKTLKRYNAYLAFIKNCSD